MDNFNCGKGRVTMDEILLAYNKCVHVFFQTNALINTMAQHLARLLKTKN